MKITTTDNNQYLLTPGTDRPQLDDNGDPVPNPNYGNVTEVDLPDPPAPPPDPVPSKAELLQKIEDLLAAVQALA